MLNTIFMILIVLLLIYIFLYLKIEIQLLPLRKFKIPPFIKGPLPWIGVGFNFAGGPLQYVTRLYEKNGEVFTLQLFGQRATFLIGPEAHANMFMRNDEELSQDEPYKFSIPIFGPNVVYDSPLVTRIQQMQFVRSSLKTEQLASYIPHIIKETQDYFSKWGQSGEIDIREALSELIILTASRCLMGREIRETMSEKVAELFKILDEGLQPISVFFPYLPIPAHKRRDNARLEMNKLFSRVMQQRRERIQQGFNDIHDDILQVFMDVQYRDGRKLTDSEVSGLMIALLFAGQHTSSVTGSWTGLLMLKHTHYLQRVIEEQQIIREKYHNQLNLDSLNEMQILHRAVKEALRMFPPLIFVMRKVLKPFEFKNYYIPKDDVLFVSPALSMRLPQVFTNPDQFDPDRFSSSRAEDIKTKHSFVGFGAGRHGCLGENFAYLQIKTIWSVLLHNFDLQLIGELPKPDYSAMVVGPTQPCLIRFKRKSNSN
eukprot:TRINITY_DN115_c2_g1_i1.p1 TRINITY_DN115_c2_g1~~TRINITY_DN115_c2_g1_i1.p1  ORF type:complete len:485 (+),score=241.22 TRINITY_DN115_c2_g1_i1:59-1513(+)